MIENKISNSNKCTCIHCRRKEIGKSYFMYQYTDVVNMVSIFNQLIEAGNRPTSLGNESDKLGSYLMSLACNIDEELSCIFEDNPEVIEGTTFFEALDEWKLRDSFNNIVSLYEKLDKIAFNKNK